MPHETHIRVRYTETDQMGFVHHSNYLTYFEIARTEMLRDKGGSYRDFEASGLLVVVVKLDCHYRKPARYDDNLVILTEIVRVTLAKMEHRYCVMRGDELLTEAHVVMAVVDHDGNVQRVPEYLIP